MLSLNGDTLVGITIGANSVPSITLLDENFEVITPAALDVPQGLKLTISEPEQVTVAWIDIFGEKEYLIERKTGSGGAWSTLGTLPANSITFEDNAVSPGNTYHYRVTAKSDLLTSGPSTEAGVDFAAPMSRCWSPPRQGPTTRF